MPLKHWPLGTSTSRKPVPATDHTFGKEMLLNIQSKLPLVQLGTILICAVTGYNGKEISTFLSSPLLFLRKQWDYLFFSPNYISPKLSVTLHRTFLPALSLALLPAGGGCLQQEAQVEKKNRILYLRITVDIQDLETRKRVCIWFLEAKGVWEPSYPSLAFLICEIPATMSLVLPNTAVNQWLHCSRGYSNSKFKLQKWKGSMLNVHIHMLR